VPSVRIVGPGKAGSSLALALATVGWDVADPIRRGDDPSAAARAVDLCVIATPDAAVAPVAAAITPVPTTVLAHLSGSLPADVLLPHPRRAALHPLASLPDSATGAAALQHGCWFAIDGDPLVTRVVADLGGRLIAVPPQHRAAYHAAACIAANHVLILLAQVERIAEANGLPAAPFYDLAAQALANARTAGAAGALTGPAKRGDLETLERHRAALDARERPLYDAVAGEAGRTAEKDTADRAV
jgi:predicted short-subunit dehydrogenase-like oxidoreductase (DUF2520 family)